MKKLLASVPAITAFIIVIAITVLLIQLIGVGIDYVRVKLKLPVENTNVNLNIESIEVPEVDQAPEIIEENIVEPEDKTEILKIISEPYVPSTNVLSNKEVYKTEAAKLALSGRFDKAQIRVTGTINDDKNYFILFNYGIVSGTLNGTRLSENRLDVNLTKLRGGVFNKEIPIDFTVDLLGETTLATTKEEFESTKQSIKFVNLWESNLLPPTITRVLVAPFNDEGIFGGATISEIDFEYTCESGYSCDVKLCSQDKKTTECLTEYFGLWSAKDWCKRSNIKGCENL